MVRFTIWCVHNALVVQSGVKYFLKLCISFVDYATSCIDKMVYQRVNRYLRRCDSCHRCLAHPPPVCAQVRGCLCTYPSINGNNKGCRKAQGDRPTDSERVLNCFSNFFLKIDMKSRKSIGSCLFKLTEGEDLWSTSPQQSSTTPRKLNQCRFSWIILKCIGQSHFHPTRMCNQICNRLSWVNKPQWGVGNLFLMSLSLCG